MSLSKKELREINAAVIGLQAGGNKFVNAATLTKDRKTLLAIIKEHKPNLLKEKKLKKLLLGKLPKQKYYYVIIDDHEEVARRWAMSLFGPDYTQDVGGEIGDSREYDGFLSDYKPYLKYTEKMAKIIKENKISSTQFAYDILSVLDMKKL